MHVTVELHATTQGSVWSHLYVCFDVRHQRHAVILVVAVYGYAAAWCLTHAIIGFTLSCSWVCCTDIVCWSVVLMVLAAFGHQRYVCLTVVCYGVLLSSLCYVADAVTWVLLYELATYWFLCYAIRYILTSASGGPTALVR